MGTQALTYFQDRYRDCQWEPLSHRSSTSIRSVYRLVRDGLPVYYIKIYDPATPMQRLVNRLRPRTLHEVRMLERLRRSGIRVPGVAAHLRCGPSSALVTAAVEPVRQLWDLDRGAQASVLLDMAVALLQKGFFYTDLHAGNVLLDQDNRPVLIDAYEIRPLARIRPRHVIELISQVQSVYGLGDTDLDAALARLPGQPGDRAHLICRIKRRSAELHARRVGRWIRRSLSSGSFSRRERGNAYTALVNRRFPIDIPAVLAGLASTDHPAPVLAGQHAYTLSPFARSGWSSTPGALQAWKGLLTLFFNDVPCATPVAAVVRKDRSSVLITTGDHDLPTLEAWLHSGFEEMGHQEKLRCAAMLGRIIGDLHAKHIRHAGLVCSGLALGQDPLRCLFLPSSGVRQRRGLSTGERVRALTRFGRSLPVTVGRTLKLAFLKAYAEATGDDLRRLARGASASGWRA